LLGLDWFIKTGASINPSSSTLRFGPKTFLCNSASVINQNTANQIVEDSLEGRLDEFMDQESSDDEDLSEAIPKLFEVKTEIKLDNNLEQKFKNELAPIIIERSTGELATYIGPSMPIEVTSQIPVNRKFFRRSQADNDDLQAHIDELHKLGIVEESTSPYDSPAFLVKKKNGKKRLIHDYREINLLIVSMIFPIPLVSFILDLLAGFSIFSTLDLKNGFFQCPLEINSRKYTAFSTAKGHYQYTRCPQGIKTGPAWFSLCVDQAMRECRGFAINYFDDVVIYSSSVIEHFSHVKRVLESLKKFGFKIAPEKSTWFATSVSLLGYIVSGSHVKINPEKIITIKNRPEPKNSKQVQQALGLFNFYRRFIDKFADMSKCLYELIKKDTPFVWTDECSKNYKYFIDCLTTEPAMAQPILGQPFIVYSDGSKFAIGGVLAQVINGVEHIIEYTSRLLRGPELNYGISDIECLACVFLIKKWHHYLYGTHFTLYTDHKALTQLMSIKDYVGRLGRQAMLLQEYTFTIKYLPGEENSAADIASRPAKYALAVTTRSKINQNTDQIENYSSRNLIDPYDDFPLIYRLQNNKHLSGISSKQVKSIDKKLEHYKMEDNVISIKKDNKWKVIPFKEDRIRLIEQSHLLGHFGIDTTLSRLEENYYWKGMLNQVEKFIKKCLPCARNKNFKPIEHPAKALPVNGIFDRVAMDITGNFPRTKEGYIKLLVIKEYLTKLVRIYPLKTKEKEEVAANFWRWITLYGPPKEILTDQGGEFVNGLMDSLLSKLGIERRVTSAYFARTDGCVEKANDTVVTVLRTHAESDNLNWIEWIPFVEYAYNTRKHSATKFSPYELLYGIKVNEFTDYRNQLNPNSDDIKDLLNRTNQLRNLVQNTRNLAIENIQSAQEIQIQAQNKRFNVTETPLEIGTPVLVKNEGIIGKLEPRYRGKYYVDGQASGGNYKLIDSTGIEGQSKPSQYLN
jgi:transposase InsO family protein